MSASKTDTAEAYEEYLRLHPGGVYGEKSRKRLEEFEALKEADLFASATKHGTAEYYREYLSANPHGKYVAEVNARVNERETRLYNTALEKNTAAACRGYLSEFPLGQHHQEVQKRLAACDSSTFQSAKTRNIVSAYEAYVREFPDGTHLAEARARISQIDDAAFNHAKLSDTVRALASYIKSYPTGTHIQDAHNRLNRMIGSGNIVDLRAEGRIELKTTGAGIEKVGLRIRRLGLEPVRVIVPTGTYFVSGRISSQNMTATVDVDVLLLSDDWESVQVPAACANRTRDIPGSADNFTVVKSPPGAELQTLMESIKGRAIQYAVIQAAIWIVTDNATFDELQILVRTRQDRFGSSVKVTVIGVPDAVEAMKICSEAGIDISQKAIWSSRNRLLFGLSANDDLRIWLDERVRAGLLLR